MMHLRGVLLHLSFDISWLWSCSRSIPHQMRLNHLHITCVILPSSLPSSGVKSMEGGCGRVGDRWRRWETPGTRKTLDGGGIEGGRKTKMGKPEKKKGDGDTVRIK